MNKIDNDFDVNDLYVYCCVVVCNACNGVYWIIRSKRKNWTFWTNFICKLNFLLPQNENTLENLTEKINFLAKKNLFSLSNKISGTAQPISLEFELNLRTVNCSKSIRAYLRKLLRIYMDVGAHTKIDTKVHLLNFWEFYWNWKFKRFST